MSDVVLSILHKWTS